VILKISGSSGPGQASFSKKYSRDHIRTAPRNMRAKFEVRIFNRFGASI